MVVVESVDDVDEVIDRNPCAKLIRKLEDCLAENNREFTKCRAG